MLDINDFEIFWHNVGDMSRINGNGYRVLIDIALHNCETTQKGFIERRRWNRTSISKTFKRLYEEHFLYCKLDGREIVYAINEDLFKNDECYQRVIKIDYNSLIKIWNVICEMNELSANCYRVFLDVLIYGETTQKELWERRGWKIAGVSATFNKLYDMNLLILDEKKGQKIYTANIDFILNKE